MSGKAWENWTADDQKVFELQASFWEMVCNSLTSDRTQYHEYLKILCTSHGVEELYDKWNESDSLTFFEELVILAGEALTGD